MEPANPTRTEPAAAVQQRTGNSGIVGGVGEGVDPHAVNASKTLVYRYMCVY